MCGQIDERFRSTFIMRHLPHERMRVSGLGSTDLFAVDGRLRFVHVPIRTAAGGGPMMAGGGPLVPSCACPVFGWADAPGGAGKSGGALVYRYIYICHTLQTCTIKQVSYI